MILRHMIKIFKSRMSEVKTKEKGEKRKRPKGAQDPNHCDVDCTNSELKLWLVKGM